MDSRIFPTSSKEPFMILTSKININPSILILRNNKCFSLGALNKKCEFGGKTRREEQKGVAASGLLISTSKTVHRL